MTVLFIAAGGPGADTQTAAPSSGWAHDGWGSVIGTSPVVGATAGVGRSSAVYYEAAANAQSQIRVSIGRTDGRGYYHQVAFRADTNWPSSTVTILAQNASWALRLTATGTLILVDGAGTQIGSASAAQTLGQWFVVEVYAQMFAAADDTIEARVGGTAFVGPVTQAVSATVGTNFDVGPAAAYGATRTIRWTDVVVLDDQGSATENTWPDQARIRALLPIADVSRDANWTDNDNTTTNLWDSVNALPPAGVLPASGAGTANLQIKNSAADAVGNVVFDLQPIEQLGALAVGQLDSGVTADNSGTDELQGFKFTAAATADVDRISATFKQSNAGLTSVELGIYADSAGLPGALLGKATYSGNPGGGWFTVTLAAPVSLTAGTAYWLAWNPHGASTVWTGTTSANARWRASQASMPNPFGTPGGSGAALPSIYAWTALPAGEQVIATQCRATHGISSTTSTTRVSLEMPATSGHPAVAEATLTDPNAVAGAWPSNWGGASLAVQSAPAITDPTVPPRVEVGKRDSATRVLGVAQVRLDVLTRTTASTTPVSQTFELPYETATDARTTIEASYEAEGAGTPVAQTFALPIEALTTPGGGTPVASLPLLLNFAGGGTTGAVGAWESTTGIASPTGAPWEADGSANVPVSQTFTLPIEGLADARATASAPWDAPTTIGTAVPAVWEAATGVRSAVATGWEALLGLGAPAIAPLEALAPVSGTAAVPFDALLGAIATQATAWEAQSALTQTAALALEALTGLRPAWAGPWEADGNFLVSASFVLPHEALGSIAAQIGGPLEALTGGISTQATAPYETATGLTRTAALAWEALLSPSGNRQAPWDSVAVAVGAVALTWEAEGGGPLLITYVDYDGPLSLTLDEITRTLELDPRARTLALDAPERSLLIDEQERTLTLAGPSSTLTLDSPSSSLVLDDTARLLEVDP